MNDASSTVSDGLALDTTNNKYVDLGSITFGSSFSIEMYVNPSTNMDTSDYYFYSSSSSSSFTDSIIIRFFNNGFQVYLKNTEGNGVNITHGSGMNHNYNEWAHFELTVLHLLFSFYLKLQWYRMWLFLLVFSFFSPSVWINKQIKGEERKTHSEER